jgi:DNA polymerase-1
VTEPAPENAPGETLYLIDGYAAIFRAYFAIRRPLYSPETGEETQAVLVFARMLHKLYTTLGPDYVAVALDAPGATFRDELYGGYFARPEGEPATAPVPAGETPTEAGEEAPETPPVSGYKGTRQATPDGLTAQIPRILELLELLGVPTVARPGLEADDVIATLAEGLTAERPGLNVRIVSKDKDLEQLLRHADAPASGRVTLYDVHTGEEYDRAALWAKRGVTPAQVPDLLALTGDAVDNVPGVPGIGGKTAAKLLQQFGSLDGVLANLDRVPERLRGPLEGARTVTLPLSRRLVTLERDPELTRAFDLEAARVRRPLLGAESQSALCRFFDTMGFRSLKEQFNSLCE